MTFVFFVVDFAAPRRLDPALLFLGILTTTIGEPIEEAPIGRWAHSMDVSRV